MTDRGWRELVAAVPGGVQMVATDLDGTLLRPDNTVSSRTIDAFAAARAAGLPVVFVTGRPPRWLPPVVEATGHAGIGVCANGALVIDLDTHAVLETHPIAYDVVAETVAALRSEIEGVAFALEWDSPADADDFAHEPSYRARYRVAGVEHGDILTLAARHPVIKLLARIDGGDHPARHDVDALLDVTLGHVSHLVTATHSASDDVLIEMSALGVSKGAALAHQAARLGVPLSSVAAVGDMPNDVPMLVEAGVGLAVETGHPAARAAAAALLPGPEDDGLAQLVEAVLAAR
ncbi:HAD-IIB family hydrolase [Longivirga aurantiaca]|uniref:HAD-IIB family hydrolase n=1 Tax=Longivirga aurantiaca TaxID=1837743 RepID=A0ABW1T4E4_9ACTN